MAVFSDEFADRAAPEKIVTLGEYLPVRRSLDARGMLRYVREGGESGYTVREVRDLDAAVRWTRKIDALNLGRRWPQKQLLAQLDPMLAGGIAVAVVPSHNPFTAESAIRELAQVLAANADRRDATGCLVRHERIQRIVYGGPSYLKLHYESIRVEASERFFGRAVLLLDDIAKSGASLRACRQLLLDAGAAEVQMLALGRVVR